MKIPALLLDRVIVRELPMEEVKAGSIVIAGVAAVGDVRRGRVLAHGPGHFEDGVFHPLDLFREGDVVLYHNHKAIEVKLGDMSSEGSTFITNGRDVIGVFEG